MGIEVPCAFADLLDLGQALEHGLFGVEDPTVPGARLVVVSGSGKVPYEVIELPGAEVARGAVHASRLIKAGLGALAASARRRPMRICSNARKQRGLRR